MLKLAVVGAGVSGLIAAYRLQERLRGAGCAFALEVFEAEDRLGGTMRTERDDGFLCECAGNGFLDNKPRTPALCKDLGLTLLPSNPSARKRFIWSKGRLHLLPGSPPAFFTSGLLSVPGRLRILLEPFLPKNTEVEDETLAAFAVRRLGREAYETLLDPMVSGVFAGNPEVMSLRSSFPRIHELEQRYGSLVKAMVALGMEKRRVGGGRTSDRAGPAGPGGVLTSFTGGMQELVDALGKHLDGKVRLSTPLAGIEKNEAGKPVLAFDLQGGGRLRRDFDQVILALPAPAAAAAFSASDPTLAAQLERIPYSAVSVVHLGYEGAAAATLPEGFGFLIPSRERRRILGALFASSIFEHRAPAGERLFTAIVGGARHPELALLSRDSLVELVQGELAELVGLTATPLFVKVIRHEQAIPQYLVGHKILVEELEAGVRRAWPGVRLTGNAYRGVALNDCVLEAERVVEDFASEVLR